MTEFKIRFCPAGHQMELKNWRVEVATAYKNPTISTEIG